jgi:arylsulfatase
VKKEKKMKHSNKVFGAVLVLFVVMTLTVGSAFAAKKPNIVLVFLDNFGWGEPGFNGGGIIRGAATPRMDKLALS